MDVAYEVVPATGDSNVDDLVNQSLAPAVETAVAMRMNGEEYKGLKDDAKKVLLLKDVQFLRIAAKKYAETAGARIAAVRADKLQVEFDNYKANTSNTPQNKSNLLAKELELIRAQYDAYTGPFARATWLNASKDFRKLADHQVRQYKERLQLHAYENRDYVLTDMDKLVLYGKGYTTEELGIYGIGSTIAKDIKKNIDSRYPK